MKKTQGRYGIAFEDCWTVAELLEALKEFPPNYRIWAYEGEVTGIIVSPPMDEKGDRNDGAVIETTEVTPAERELLNHKVTLRS